MSSREWLEFHPDRRLEIVSPGARDVPPFLLHLVSQVQITAETTTEYLDRRAGIVRTARERLERSIGENLRKLGKEQAQEALQGFARIHRERAAEALAEKLRSLPVIDGQPGTAALGDPAVVVKHWAAELHLTPEDQLRQFLGYLEDMRAREQLPSEETM